MSHCIRGDVLEIYDSDYTHRYGAEGLQSHVLDLDVTNDRATIFGDLCDPDTLAPEAYDCVILTQTLQYLVVPDTAIANLYTSLRPGGTLLITAPCSAQMYQLAPESDYWRVTATYYEHWSNVHVAVLRSRWRAEEIWSRPWL